MRKFFMLILATLFIFIPTGVVAQMQEFPENLKFLEVSEELTNESVEVPIIMYHLVTEKSKYIGKYGITPSEFKQDLQFLRENGYNTIVMQDLINFVDHGTPLPPNPIMLTIDDGNFSDYEYVLPLLQEFEKKAVLAVIAHAADKYTKMSEENPKSRFPNLTWEQVKSLHESGFAEIQNHSYNLHDKGGSGKRKGESAEAYHSRLLNDLTKMQEGCQSVLGYAPTAFVYPLGVIGDGSREVLNEIGLRGSFSCQEGMNVIRRGDADSLFLLKRTNRPSGRSIEVIIKSIVASR